LKYTISIKQKSSSCPQDDPGLCEANLKLGKARQAEGRQVVYIKIELMPQLRTAFVPRLRLAQVST